MTVRFTTVESSEIEKDPNLSLDAKKWIARDEEKEEREEDYRQVAKWVHYSCDDPIGEIAWLIQVLFEKNGFEATFKDIYGDVLELEDEHDRY